MIKVVLFGAGNVATHLTKTFLNSDEIELIQVYNKTLGKISYLSEKIDIKKNLKDIKKADIYIISISDDAIADFSKKLDLKNSLVVHTSGSVAMDKLQSTSRKGIFYPLQTFSKEAEINFKEVPICIEAEAENDLKLLKKLANSISDKVYEINSEQRKSLHVAAVFVNNFVNHLYYQGKEICTTHNVPFEILQPLIAETAKKIIDLPPFEAQTGPAKRNDQKTIENHLELLDENQQKIYKTLTKSILKTYGKEL